MWEGGRWGGEGQRGATGLTGACNARGAVGCQWPAAKGMKDTEGGGWPVDEPLRRRAGGAC